MFVWYHFCLWIVWCQVLVLGYVDELTTKFTEPSVKTLRSGFGMAKGGEIRINYQIEEENINLLVLVIDESQYYVWYDSYMDSEDAETICTLPSMHRMNIANKGSLLYSVHATDRYTVMVVLCDQLSTPIHLHVRTEMVNPSISGSHWNHLPIQSVLIIRLWLGKFLAYLGMFIIVLAQNHYYAKEEYVKVIHQFFSVNLGICTGSALFSYLAAVELNEEGVNSKGIVFMDNFFSAVRSALFYFTVLILALGWSITKETASLQEYQVVLGFFIFYLVLGVSQAICIAVSDDLSDCQVIPLFLYILRGIVIISSIIAMNYTVSHLRTLITNLAWCPSIPYLYVRLKNYYNFRSFYLLYILLPTVVLMLQVTMLTWKEEWVVDLLNDIITLLFYFLVGIIFSPVNLIELNRPFDGSLIPVEDREIR